MASVPAAEKLTRYVNDPWDQQPGESARQYARFLKFAAMPARDRRAGVQDRATGLSAVAREEGVTPSTVWEVAERFRWRDRAALWDAAKLRAQREEIADKEVQLAERAINNALVTTAIIGRSLRALADGKTVLEPKDLPAFAKMAETFRRMAIDAPDAVVKLAGVGDLAGVVPDFAGLSDEQISDRAGEMAQSILRVLPGGKTG